MATRRDVLKLGVAGGSALGGAMFFGTQRAKAQLCPPDGTPPVLEVAPSPPATPFRAPLFVMPVNQPVPRSSFNPPPDPHRHQRFSEFPPQKFYRMVESEFRWVYHPDPPYDAGSYSWGFNGITPGPTYHNRYGQPLFTRRINNLPPVGVSKVTWALPSTTIHAHNMHTASESDGIPMDYIDPGEFWDHHYAMFPAGNDPLEKLHTLWYHDHRQDFTAPNVYAGLSGFFLNFDQQDSGDEHDPSPYAWNLPSGRYDVPLMLHDVQFGADGQIIFDNFLTDGWLGDQMTVNRRISPFFEVEARKYRFRLLNGGPSRFYELFLSTGQKFTVLTNDGNFYESPLEQDSLQISVAQRQDVIIDFSRYSPGDQIILYNRLEQTNGRGPTGRLLDPGYPMMRFDVVPRTRPDRSKVPDFFRPQPKIDFGEVRRHRTWVFDYDGGMWTVNGKIFDPNRIDAGIEQGTAEIWTIRNAGSTWSHPIHTHFEEFQIFEKNGRKIRPGSRLDVKKDVISLGPGDEVKFFGRWRDFLGRHVMHCHNVVHEDHAMMIRWDIVPPGQGF